MATMKAVRIHQYGGNDEVMYGDAPRPAPAAGEVLVRVRAAGVNPLDWKLREGYMREWFDLAMPITMGRDFAGDVVEVGSGVTDFQVGDAVFGFANLSIGTHAEYVAVPAPEVARKPAALDYVTAAAVPLSALAAWQALVETADVSAGQTVLIHGAGGGVGGFAVQFARLRGARVIGTDSQANAEFVRSLGAEAIDYATTRFEDGVQDVDVVLDLIAGDTQARSWQVLKPGGILVTTVYLPPGAMEEAAARGVRAVLLGAHPSGEQLRQIGELVSTGQVTVRLNTVLPLGEARHAYALSQSGEVGGKIVLQVAQD